jgi:hypothetical protein
MSKIITTVGTSVLTNYQKQEVVIAWEASNEKKYTPINLKELEEKGASEYDNFLSKSGAIKKVITNFWLRGIKRKEDGYYSVLDDENKLNTEASAEIKSILKIAEQANDSIEVYLLATDTVLSRLACELIVAWFHTDEAEAKPYLHTFITKNLEGVESNKSVTITIHFKPEKEYICEGLRVVGDKAGDDFAEKGFFSLIENIEHHKPDMLCFSGGYKSIIPIMTIIGQIKGMPLYCIYEDDNSSLIEIGNLPINFDWGMTQLLKPFLGIKHHPIWKNNGKELAQQLATSIIKFKNEQFVSDIVEIDASNQKKLTIFKKLFDHKLINKNTELTLFGKLFQKVSELEYYRGYEMEYILYHYFSQFEDKREEVVREYSVVPAYEFIGSFKVENHKMIVRSEPESGNWVKVGDIDLPLKRGKINVLGEVKSFSNLLVYQEEEGGRKYLKQLEARLRLFCLKYPEKFVINDNDETFLELLFIVHQFQFEEYKTSIIEMDLVKTIFSKFKILNECQLQIKKDNRVIKVNPIFRLAGVQCVVTIDTNKMLANYTSFYQNPKLEWEIIENTNPNSIT